MRRENKMEFWNRESKENDMKYVIEQKSSQMWFTGSVEDSCVKAKGTLSNSLDDDISNMKIAQRNRE